MVLLWSFFGWFLGKFFMRFMVPTQNMNCTTCTFVIIKKPTQPHVALFALYCFKNETKFYKNSFETFEFCNLPSEFSLKT